MDDETMKPDEVVVVSKTVVLYGDAEISCEYNGCSGDCNCDGD
jgi:hypothetical protein